MQTYLPQTFHRDMMKHSALVIWSNFTLRVTSHFMVAKVRSLFYISAFNIEINSSVILLYMKVSEAEHIQAGAYLHVHACN